MKKIIYSLVIMIAAGSLFTSCIAQTELDGDSKEMIKAKKDYISYMRDLMKSAAEADELYVKALANKAQAEADYINAQKDLLDALTEAQVIEANAKAAKAKAEAEIATTEAELICKKLRQQIDEFEDFMSPAMQKVFISAAMAYYGAEEAVFALTVKYETAENPVVKEQFRLALKAAEEVRDNVKKYWDKVKSDVVSGGFKYVDPTEAIEDLLGALPDDTKSAIMDKILEALASIVD